MSACVLQQEVPAGPIDARTVLGNVQPWSYCFYVLVDLDANLAPAFTRPSRGNASYTQSRCYQCSYVGRLSRRCAPLDANAPSSPSVRTAIWTMLEFSDGTQCEVREAYVDADAFVEHAFHVRKARDTLFGDFAYDHQMTDDDLWRAVASAGRIV